MYTLHSQRTLATFWGGDDHTTSIRNRRDAPYAIRVHAGCHGSYYGRRVPSCPCDRTAVGGGGQCGRSFSDRLSGANSPSRRILRRRTLHASPMHPGPRRRVSTSSSLYETQHYGALLARRSPELNDEALWMAGATARTRSMCGTVERLSTRAGPRKGRQDHKSASQQHRMPLADAVAYARCGYPSVVRHLCRRRTAAAGQHTPALTGSDLSRACRLPTRLSGNARAHRLSGERRPGWWVTHGASPRLRHMRFTDHDHPGFVDIPG